MICHILDEVWIRQLDNCDGFDSHILHNIKLINNFMSTFMISDPHFGHINLCRAIRKMTIEESDELIIRNWNRVVKKQDLVYLIGDVTMESYKLIPQYIKRLKGSIYVVGGNHDDRKCCQMLASLGIPVLGCVEYKGFIITHIPVREEEACYYTANIHGHIHANQKTYLPERKYYNVNCELHNYTPVNFEEIREFYNNIRL